MTDPIPVVTAVEVLHDFVVGVTFDDGTVGEVDLLAHLWGPVFEPLRDDPGLFARVRVDAEEGTIVWPNGADVAPEMLHRDATAAGRGERSVASPRLIVLKPPSSGHKR